MKILIFSKFTTGATKEGGSGRFMKCVIDTLEILGHWVTTDITEDCDLIIASHDTDKIKNKKAKKIFISHGIVEEEDFKEGADRYISISREIQLQQAANGFTSDVVGQPITIGLRHQPRFRLQNILIIRRDEQQGAEDPFAFLFDHFNVRVSDPDIPIEKQIDWADLCITLGRGALESMARGKPVLVADCRNYMGAKGDGYVTPGNIDEIALNNFSGRRFNIPLTEEWILSELAKYDQHDSFFLYNYVREHHKAQMIVKKYLEEVISVQRENKVAFGCMVNNKKKLDKILRNSALGRAQCYTIHNPDTATKGLNTLLDIIEESEAEIGVLTHQDMFYANHWLSAMENQIKKLPEDWVIAGLVGKDLEGDLCGRFHDMSTPLWIVSNHRFPVECSCIDECTIIVNMKSGFRFEEMEGFDLYGTYACLRAKELGSAWIIDAWAEHYCTRFHTGWEPDAVFIKMWKWLYDRFPGQKLDSTVLVNEKNQEQLEMRRKLRSIQAAS